MLVRMMFANWLTKGTADLEFDHYNGPILAKSANRDRSPSSISDRNVRTGMYGSGRRFGVRCNASALNSDGNHCRRERSVLCKGLDNVPG